MCHCGRPRTPSPTSCNGADKASLFSVPAVLKSDYDKACAMSDEHAKEVRDLIDQLSKSETDIQRHWSQIDKQNETIHEKEKMIR